MKVVSAKTMSTLEAQAYQMGYAEDTFMENAGAGIANEVQNFIEIKQLQKNVLLLCGKGNNGGDAFVAGRHLLHQNYIVNAIQLDPLDVCSPLCQQNAQRFLSLGGQIIQQNNIKWSTASLIVDGIFGTGFKGQIKDPYASLIQSANESRIPILAIDIPSGLNGSTGQIEGIAIRATETIFLGLPKTGFFLENAWNYVGKLRGIDFGLPLTLIDQLQVDFELITHRNMIPLLPSIKRNRHKYEAGYVIGLAGSPGMPGAALLSSYAVLRGGSGMMHLLYPAGMEAELSTSPYELIKIPYQWQNHQHVLQEMQKGKATFVGPGLGRHLQARQLLYHIMPALEKPCVIDADALILFSEEAFTLPQQAVLTPHTGEMQHLLHLPSPLKINLETLRICQNYAEENQITLVLKGAPTFILHPKQPILVNPTGDPGMATAGSGDVLTGLIASLLSQGLERREAASLGVYLHGLAGEFAAQELTSSCMIASDIINHFSYAYQFCQKQIG